MSDAKKLKLTSVAIDDARDTRMKWLFQPDAWTLPSTLPEDKHTLEEVEGYGGSFSINEHGHLTLAPPAKKDFWRRTFYTPILIKGDAPAFVVEVPPSEECTVDLTCSYTPREQFDQAGLMVFLDESHWMKCGLEYCDGKVRMSVVVCNVHSDWSVVPWESNSIQLRVHKINQGSAVVVEAAPVNSPDSLHFVRIAHLSAQVSHTNVTTETPAPEALPWQIGPFAACPIAQRGATATFTTFTVGPLKPSSHSSTLSD
eukprot:m.59786 g.59786  ORF g.59786 m.59786 type:complete len:257 (-) comp22756_c1_seq1:140-910(-)